MRPPRHILMTADTVGDLWTHALDLCAGLARYGVEVTLVTNGRLPDDMQTAEVPGNVTLVPTPFRTEWMSGGESDLGEFRDELARLERELEPDAVHLNSFAHAGLRFRAPVLLAVHSCVTTWWQACRDIPLPQNWDSYTARVAQAVADADVLVAPTASFLADFQSHHGAAKPAHVIHDGRPSAMFKPGVKRRIVLASGRLWDEAKNIDLLRRVADNIDLPIVVAGELVAPDGTIFEAHGLAALGRLSPAEMARWMSEAAIYAAPCRYEPFGLGVLEAALSGCALVLGDIPTLRELWDGVATFIDPDDPAGLRRAIRMLSDMPQLAASDGEKARERALQLSAEKMSDAYYQLYLEMRTGAGVMGEAAA